jgi:hypothetical protein
MAALRGDKTNIGARLPSELGKGTALFASEKLVALNLLVDSAYDDVTADMERRFGVAGKKYTVTRPGSASIQEMRWEASGVLASVSKNRFSEGVTILVGYLQPPYGDLLRGTGAPGSPTSAAAAPRSAPTGASL